MAGKVAGKPRLDAERIFEANRFALDQQRQAFDYLLHDVQPLTNDGSIEAELAADSKEGVAA